MAAVTIVRFASIIIDLVVKGCREMSVERTEHQLFARANLEDACLMRLPGRRLSRSIVEKDLYD